MKIAYRFTNFRNDSLQMIAQANVIAETYQRQGYSLTLRQIYYQFVSRDLLPNNQKSYKRLGSVLNDARLGGLLDWSYMMDRTRGIIRATAWESPSQIIETAAQGFQRDLWEITDQQYRPQVWVEKDALENVIGRPCDELRVPYLSCRGYVSQSEMWLRGREIGKQFSRGLTPVIIHLGDHDPSGIDMSRDIEDRLSMFAGRPVEVKRIALNMDQVEQYDPPPNPAKFTDSRAEEYVRTYGYESWELDALEPSVLDALVRENLEPYIDSDAWAEGEAEDAAMRSRMGDVATRWDEISDRWSEIEEMLT